MSVGDDVEKLEHSTCGSMRCWWGRNVVQPLRKQRRFLQKLKTQKYRMIHQFHSEMCTFSKPRTDALIERQVASSPAHSVQDMGNPRVHQR